jgi:single-strand DNA-binding protein
MAGYNRVVMIGNLTRDPDYKQLTSGQPVCRLGLASNRQYRNKQSGSMVQEVCFIDVDVFGPQAESCRLYLQKGRPVLIEGRLKFDSWQSPEGQARTKHSIVADRVVFLSTGGAQLDEAGDQAQDSSSADLDSLLAATKVKKKPKVQAPQAEGNFGSGELSFQDEPPFQDDLLPF